MDASFNIGFSLLSLLGTLINTSEVTLSLDQYFRRVPVMGKAGALKPLISLQVKGMRSINSLTAITVGPKTVN